MSGERYLVTFNVTASPTNDSGGTGNAVHSIEIKKAPAASPASTAEEVSRMYDENVIRAVDTGKEQFANTDGSGYTKSDGNSSRNWQKPIRTENIKVVETRNPEVANTEWLEKGYDKLPYDPSYEVKIVQAGSNNFVRVFSYNFDGTSNKLGGWIMLKSDVEGLTPAQIADKYALPKIPTHFCDVIVSPEYELQTGIANRVDEWGRGGGQQFDTMGKRLPISSFVNEKMIGE